MPGDLDSSEMRPEGRIACGCHGPRRTVTDYTLNPCRRTNGTPAGVAGEPAVSHDGATIQFGVELDGRRVAGTGYRSSSCATLVAYAEVLGELVVGRQASEALEIVPETIIERLPGVPIHRQERAVLVVRAWWSALAKALEIQDRGEIS